MDIQSRAGDTGLPRVVEQRARGTLYGRIEIGVGKNNDGRLATKLKTDFLQIAAGGVENRLTYRGRSGKRDLVDEQMIRQSSTCHFTDTRDNINDAGRHPGFNQ